MKVVFLILLFVGNIFNLAAQDNVISLNKDEKWFGGDVNEAHLMPLKEGYGFDLYGNTWTNQAVSLLVSTKGRFVWSEEPFRFAISNNQLVISNRGEALVVDSSGKNLREAYLNAGKRFFPSKGKLPDTLLFTSPQYNNLSSIVHTMNDRILQ